MSSYWFIYYHGNKFSDKNYQRVGIYYGITQKQEKRKPNSTMICSFKGKVWTSSEIFDSSFFSLMFKIKNFISETRKYFHGKLKTRFFRLASSNIKNCNITAVLNQDIVVETSILKSLVLYFSLKRECFKLKLVWKVFPSKTNLGNQCESEVLTLKLDVCMV